MSIKIYPIGVIHTPFSEREGMPIQPNGKAAGEGIVEVFPEFEEGLQDLEGFSHIILIYYFHEIKNSKLKVVPFLDDEPHGVFATRAPVRPNKIGLSVVELVRREGNKLYVKKIDILAGTPLLDIKPYVPEFDAPEGEIRVGWLAGKSGKDKISDKRF
jgi:tRNA-Thr(GGU) m(6)t(6)A37 methyltransferase TsaA